MARWRGLLTWLRAEDGFTFSLNFAFLTVTVGMMFLLILAWFASGLAAGTDLRRAAEAAALAAQSQVTQAVSASNAGFLEAAGWQVTGSYATAAETTFSQEVSDMHLSSVFENLSCHPSVVGIRVIVTVSGQFLPIFLEAAAKRAPGLQALAVPMKVSVPVEYKVVGEGGT
ncbi:hypothetical protein URH17368_2601 [Alicyclobacillus hesperidum URH17-3-68]|uniref:hypothetical protein n=1 Tax=Alicyclobacillus hesperidum TaxID=89784 RepID=UPI000281C3B9|nr:hypothetical protein [Alicyclobacillus hesperidum]EJY54759.1 hypothetical protein URH17368_2601 [Alicyclobacillus hesperidum URH17-3-68]